MQKKVLNEKTEEMHRQSENIRLYENRFFSFKDDKTKIEYKNSLPKIPEVILSDKDINFEKSPSASFSDNHGDHIEEIKEILDKEKEEIRTGLNSLKMLRIY